jgi:two-component system, response regulator
MNEGVIEILLIEDNEDDAELALIALKKNNFIDNITILRDGQEALDFIFSCGGYLNRGMKTYPSVILLDLNLPKVGGLDVLKILKADEKTKMIPIVVMTSSSQDKDIFESYNHGANSFITKPIDFDSFINTVSSMGNYWLSLNKRPFL